MKFFSPLLESRNIFFFFRMVKVFEDQAASLTPDSCVNQFKHTSRLLRTVNV